ncbi:MAG: hypothetical protein IPH36_16830 [Saprospiraceae bacterium]|nr:hypothetical protein [Saprospiraceae bacterium]
MEDHDKYDCVLYRAWSVPPACSIDCSQIPGIDVDLGADVVLTCLSPCTTLVAEKNLAITHFGKSENRRIICG